MTERTRVGPDLLAIRAQLEATRAHLEEQIRRLDLDELALAESRDQEGGPLSDIGDVASDLVEQEIDEALEESVRGQLAEVEAALIRLNSDTYGVCQDCGQPIDPERLRALQWARRCVACQTAAERRSRRTR